MKQCIIIFLLLMLISCSKAPLRNNPYDPDYELPVVSAIEVSGDGLGERLVSWEYDLEGIEGFIIEREVAGEREEAGRVEVKEYLDDSLPVNTSYRYIVTAYAGDNRSADGFSVEVENIIPTVNVFYVEQIDLLHYRLVWNCEEIEGEDGYKLQRMIGEGDWEDLVILDAESSEYIDELEVNRNSNRVEYNIRVMVGEEFSDMITTSCHLVEYVENLEIERLAVAEIRLSWEQNSSEYLWYKIDRRSGYVWIEDFAETEVGAEDFWDEEVPVGTEIEYRVTPYWGDIVGFGREVGMMNSVPCPEEVEAEIVNFANIRLSWENSLAGISAIWIDKWQTNMGWIDNYAMVNGTDSLWIDSGIEISSSIKYRLKNEHEGIFSDEVESELLNTDISAPENLRLHEDGGGVILSWDFPVDYEWIEGFAVEKKAEYLDWIEVESDLGAEVREWIDNDASNRDSYRVKAFYQEYESDYSNTAVYLATYWCDVSAGAYSWGEENAGQTIDYDYEIMQYEVSNEQYLMYLNCALAQGLVRVEGGSVWAPYQGDECFVAADYEIYNLTYGRIEWVEESSEFVCGSYLDHPATGITWFGAQAYAQYYGWQLPTEEEWEKAARSDLGADYPWGSDTINGQWCNYNLSGDPWDNGTTPRGYYNGQNSGTQNAASPFGCYDMSGNAVEWTNSWYDQEISYRVLRGGGFNDLSSSLSLTSWYRAGNVSTFFWSTTGFRCVRQGLRD